MRTRWRMHWPHLLDDEPFAVWFAWVLSGTAVFIIACIASQVATGSDLMTPTLNVVLAVSVGLPWLVGALVWLWRNRPLRRVTEPLPRHTRGVSVVSPTDTREAYIGRTWTELPTWLYATHLFVFLWVGGCVGFLIARLTHA